MKISTIVLLSALLLGCSKPKITPDPVADLKRSISKAGNTWPKMKREWENIQYDVRKTDSLVSPYQAEIKATVFVFFRKSEVDPFEKEYRNNLSITLAYQEGSWILKEVVSTSGAFDKEKETFHIFKADAEMQPDDPEWDLIKHDLRLKPYDYY